MRVRTLTASLTLGLTAALSLGVVGTAQASTPLPVVNPSGPVGTLDAAYCAALKKAGVVFVQDCNFIHE